jgi:hypothetical protein
LVIAGKTFPECTPVAATAPLGLHAAGKRTITATREKPAAK